MAAWIKGGPVKFEKDHAYVVEFWATWCGPCRINIPKLTALQAKYPDKKLTVIGVSIDQDAAKLDTVKTFVEKQASRMEYTVALDAGGTNRDYLVASKQGSIPFAFIVDGSGKIAWRGHPNDSLEAVAAQVAAGTFDAKKYAENNVRFLELDKVFSEARDAQKWDDAEKTLDEIAKVRPDLAPLLLVQHYSIRSGGRNDPAGALVYAHHLADNELKNEPEALMMLADNLVGNPSLSPTDRHFATAVAKQAVDLTKSKVSSALGIYSEALKREARYDEALVVTQQAIDASGEEMERRFYADRLDQIKKAQADAASKPKPEAAPAPSPAEAPKPVAPAKP